ncbi:methyltransferase domain-containing protein [Fictibacillus nanhaiensis]|uniref:class I SAM-dependent methyltransferase n=1 Tax=Fictibacillus nanhaiensis TaxID=742169 RepID=UPI001C983E37|nr:methyltransferase domain-containing protein [Fictibacillus nanhaiensis]MBY6037716.1 methyltransferase domain-containing protein [Fictibacillus nanhaiensis]
MLRTKDATQNLFDDWAKTYTEDLQNAAGPLFGYKHSLEEACKMIQLSKGSTLLDVGIGTGAFAASLSDEGNEVWGIDLSENMLKECKKRYPTYILHQGTFTEPGLKDKIESFDVIASSFCFHEVLPDERQTACEKMYTLLKPDGKFLVLDIMFASQSAMNNARKQIGHYWDSTENYPLVQTLDEMLRHVGFKHISWKNTGPFHWAFSAQK